MALCRQLWAPSHWRRRVLELNASDERGISVVRDKIKHFASLSVGASSAADNFTNNKKKTNKKRRTPNFFGQSSSVNADDAMQIDHDDDKGKEEQEPESQTYPNPPYKIIILDEADTVTPDAQAALRRIIVRFGDLTAFDCAMSFCLSHAGFFSLHTISPFSLPLLY